MIFLFSLLLCAFTVSFSQNEDNGSNIRQSVQTQIAPHDATNNNNGASQQIRVAK